MLEHAAAGVLEKGPDLFDRRGLENLELLDLLPRVIDLLCCQPSRASLGLVVLLLQERLLDLVNF